MAKNSLVRGHVYEHECIIPYGNYKELTGIARRENRKLRKCREVMRFVVYPVPGLVPGIGQLFLLS